MLKLLFFSFFFISSPVFAAGSWLYVSHNTTGVAQYIYANVNSTGFNYYNNGFIPIVAGTYISSPVAGSPYLSFIPLTNTTLINAPVGYYTQAEMDTALGSAPVVVEQLSFAQGGEIAVAVASACLVAIGFGLVKKAMS